MDHGGDVRRLHLLRQRQCVLGNRLACVRADDGRSEQPALAIGDDPRETGGLAVGGYFIFKQDPKYEGPNGNLSPGVVQANAPIRFR